MPMLRWTPPVSMAARAEPYEVRLGERLYTIYPSIPLYVDVDDRTPLTNAITAAFAGSTVTATPE